ncbi:MAG: hypothetical protein GVY27_05980, partial [Deinococcus-Thermus bacterium]|nr:hypothetical protein [Deinococcota bacterium]
MTLELAELRDEATADGGRLVQAALVEAHRIRTLRFEVSPEAELGSVDRADGFVPVALLAAMQLGTDLHIRAPVSPRLLYGVNQVVTPILRQLDPRLGPTVVTADAAVPPASPAGRGVCTGVSGGVDSLAVLRDHLLDTPPPGFRVTHLLFNHLGSHAKGERTEALFHRRLERMRRLAAELELPMIVTRSNQDEIVGTDFARYDVLRNAAVPLLLQDRMHRFLYAAAYDYGRTAVSAGASSGRAGGLLLPALGTEAVELHLAGARLVRSDKVAAIAELGLAERHLDVCVNLTQTAVNCGHCQKCARTLLALEILGLEERFSNRFDRAAWRRKRGRFIRRTLAGESPHDQEFMDLMRRRSYQVPATWRIWAWLVRVLRHRVPARLRCRSSGRGRAAAHRMTSRGGSDNGATES